MLRSNFLQLCGNFPLILWENVISINFIVIYSKINYKLIEIESLKE